MISEDLRPRFDTDAGLDLERRRSCRMIFGVNSSIVPCSLMRWKNNPQPREFFVICGLLPTIPCSLASTWFVTGQSLIGAGGLKHL